MHNKNNTRVDVYLEKGLEELLPEDFYNMLSGKGFWVEETEDAAVVKSYPADIEAFLDYLNALPVNIKDVVVEQEKSIDYKELTKKYFRPIRIEDITILAPWHKKKRDGKYIVIEPGMAFGTGRHESTRLMFKLMGRIDMTGKSVLDLGCGSGILSLYADMLGAREVFAVDYDLDAVLSVKENLAFNNAGSIMPVCASLNDIKGVYDIILANLDIQIFTHYAGHIKGLLKNDGFIVVSGVLTRNKKDLLFLFKPFVLVGTERKNSWYGFVFKKLIE